MHNRIRLLDQYQYLFDAHKYAITIVMNGPIE